MKAIFLTMTALLLFSGASVAQTVVQPMVITSENGSAIVRVEEFTLAPGNDHLRGTDLVGLTYIDDIQKELQLVPEQAARLKEIRREIQTDMINGLQELNTVGGSKQEIQSRLSNRMVELRVNATKKIENVLLPHQVKVLREIQLKKQLKKDGSRGVVRAYCFHTDALVLQFQTYYPEALNARFQLRPKIYSLLIIFAVISSNREFSVPVSMGRLLRPVFHLTLPDPLSQASAIRR